MNALKGAAMEGIVVVDIPHSNPVSLTPVTLPYGINIRGTWVVNFKNNSYGTWRPLHKIVSTATINVNAADLSLLLPADPHTFATGYPPTHSNPPQDPLNLAISAHGY